MTLEEDAIEIYDSLKKEYYNFPKDCCKIAALAMYEKGYKIIQGKVHLDNYCNLGKFQEIIHYWNYDSFSGKEIDLSSEQFNLHIKNYFLPKIGVWLPKNRPKYYKKFRKGLKPREVF